MFSSKPDIFYLGETYAATVSSVEVYYDEMDVPNQFRVIGRMTHDIILRYEEEELKSSMIAKAKEVGGDGIIFTDVEVKRPNDSGDKLVVKAKVIRFLK
ncbi:hypothetical protein [Pontibacter harenae]|uniref:hypothetical protein n=1 Tax=Pontibacter harenae TaxID=2894083 RepID=UPI001E493372|nr:hypothetical protein [Pontibacter harenae]MCC9166204.1 hypothetical protein [Pontibacter harenae]